MSEMNSTTRIPASISAEKVVHHRLVVHRHELLADGDRQRVEPGAGSAGQDDAFSFHDECEGGLGGLSEPFASIPLAGDLVAPCAVGEVPVHRLR